MFFLTLIFVNKKKTSAIFRKQNPLLTCKRLWKENCMGLFDVFQLGNIIGGRKLRFDSQPQTNPYYTELLQAILEM